jgi:hypothetical protein
LFTEIWRYNAHVDQGLSVGDGKLLSDPLLDFLLLGLHIRVGLSVSGREKGRHSGSDVAAVIRKVLWELLLSVS